MWVFASVFCCLLFVVVFFFFFQAEDGIRDWSVTGVQTCALPISPLRVISAMAVSFPKNGLSWASVLSDPNERRSGGFKITPIANAKSA